MMLVVDGVTVFVGTAIVYVLKLKINSSSSNDGDSLPPIANSSVINTLKNMATTKNLVGLRFVQTVANSFKLGDFGTTESGVTFRLQLPSLLPWGYYLTFTTDDRLSRLLLTGGDVSSRGNDGAQIRIEEAEKGDSMKIFNFVDRSVYNIISDKTASMKREKARKALAQSFSNINLQRTWPHIQEVVCTQFEEFERMAASKETFQVRELLMKFFLRTLFKASFAVDVNMDGEEREDSINGLRYMQEQDMAALERVKEVLLPFRQYWFWDHDVRASARACQYLKVQAEKVVRLYKQQQMLNGGKELGSSVSEKSGKKTAYSLLDYLMNHEYASETHRLSDLNIIIFGGHETTAVTFSCLLIEIARNPNIKAKLLKEIDEIMPGYAPNKEQVHHTAAAGSMEHGDSQLISAIVNLPYLNMCIKEVLRLWPAAAGGNSRDLTEDLHYGGMKFPKGSNVNPHYFTIFRSPMLDRPEEFIPERWLDSNPQLPMLKEIFIPFSLGRRNCLGQNMAQFQLRMITAYFLRYFDFELLEEPTYEYFITLKPDHAPMRVKLRQ